MANEMIDKGLVYSTREMADVGVESGQYATEQGPLAFDLYRPTRARIPAPAVVIVTGFPDPAAAAFFGRALKDWASYREWARLLAASGIVAITYLNREPADVSSLLDHLRANAAALGLDPERIGVWACSGNVPNALGLLARERLACAALLYGFMLDLGGATHVAKAAAHFHFAVPAVSMDDLPRALPLLVVRAGRDQTPGLEETLQRFLVAARGNELNITLLDHPDGPHAFDLLDDTPKSREVIQEVLAFFQRALA